MKLGDLMLIGGIAAGVYYLSTKKDEPKSEDDKSDDNNDLPLELDSENDGTSVSSWLDEQGRDLNYWVFENENGEISYNDEAFSELANAMVPSDGYGLQCCNEEDNTNYNERVNMAQEWLADNEYLNDTPEILAHLMDYINMYCQERFQCDNEVIGEGGRKVDLNFVNGKDDTLLQGEDELVNFNSNNAFIKRESKTIKFS